MKKRTLGLMAWLLLVAMLTPAWATIIGALPYTLTNGSTADATQVMANYNKIISDTNANAAHNGVNSDITALTALSTPITPAQGGTTVYIGGTSTGSANAQVVASPVPTGMTLAAGQGICFIAGFTNTGATTLNANSLGAKNVFRQSPSGVQALTGGEIVSSGWTCTTYDGTQFVLQTSGYLRPGVGPLTSLASASTADLGTIASHNVNITGTTTITSFGSSASTTFPEYQITFAGALTLTNNGTSLILPGGANITTVANDTATAVYLGSGNWRVKNYAHIAPGPQTGQLQGVQTFTASGTWTRPTGVNSVLFICVGAGGGGAGATSSGSSAGLASGGGAGGFAQLYKTAPASTYTITIGTAGTGATTAANGNNGTATTVGAILTCNGGSGGVNVANGSGASSVAGGAGGTATGGDINVTGQDGSFASRGSSGSYGAAFYGADGGSSMYGAGGRAPIGGNNTQVNGNNGTGYGAGGSGGSANGTGGGTANGGNGTGGLVIAYAYY